MLVLFVQEDQYLSIFSSQYFTIWDWSYYVEYAIGFGFVLKNGLVYFH